MAQTSVDIPQLKFNKMSTAKYNELKEAGQLVENEFYITPDGGTIPEVNTNTNQQVLSNDGTNSAATVSIHAPITSPIMIFPHRVNGLSEFNT